jgi:hypothetical protein
MIKKMENQKMGRSKQRNKNKPRQAKPINAAIPEFKLLRNVGPVGLGKYAGAARFIELAPPGIQFRALTNVDHVTQISFANKVEDVKVYDEENVDGFKVITRKDVTDETVPAAFHMEKRVTGFQVICAVGGQQNEFSFSQLDLAIAYYNGLIEQLDAVGIPMALRERIYAPPPEAENDESAGLVGADGEEINLGDSDPVEDLEPEQKPH